MRTGVLIAFLAVLAATPSLADGLGASNYEDAAWKGGDNSVQSLDRILPGIRRDHPGRFYDAEGPFQGSDGQMHYRLKWMTPEGRIIWLDADAHSGRVTGPSQGGREDYQQPPGRGDYRSRYPEEIERPDSRPDSRNESHYNNGPAYERDDRGGQGYGGRDPGRGRGGYGGGGYGNGDRGGDRGGDHRGDHGGGGDWHGDHRHGGF